MIIIIRKINEIFVKMRHFSQHFEFVDVSLILTILLQNEFSIFKFRAFFKQ